MVLDLADIVVHIEQALAAVSPELADEIPDGISTLALDISSGNVMTDVAQLAERLRLITSLFLAVSAVLLVALVALESSVFSGLTRMGLTLAAVGLALVVLRGVGAAVVGSYGETRLETDALSGAWDVVFGDLATWGWVLVVAGGFLAALGWATVQAVSEPGRSVRLLERLRQEPQTSQARVLRTIGLLLVALWALLQPATLLLAAVRVAGFVAAVSIVSRVLDTSGLAARLRRMVPESADEVVGLGSVARRALASLAVIGGLGAAGVLLLSADDDASALADPEACNGHAALCDRRLDEVTLATSHNAMSSTATGFLLPNHLTTMRAQLDQGVRGFMIDMVYGRETPDGPVITSFEPVSAGSLDDASVVAAEATRNLGGSELAEERVYLCHAFCEIGAVDAVEALSDMRRWIDAHPREVVVFIVQDATSPDDTAAVFDDAGFGPLVHTQEPGESLPSLGELIDSGRRVFVLVEEDAGEISWLHDAFEFSQETPFSFGSADEFTCAENRGKPASPLFVVNHFITFARAGNRTINDFDSLLARAEECEAERGLPPNMLAVDFVSEGDVMAVIDRLNGVD